MDEAYRFFVTSGDHRPGGPSTWEVIDWDQRRVIAVATAEPQEDDVSSQSSEAPRDGLQLPPRYPYEQAW